MAVLLAGATYLTYYYHVIRAEDTIFTHFFYVPIILASFWWMRKGMLVAVYLSLALVGIHFLRDSALPVSNDFPRIAMFLGVSYLVAFTRERIEKAEQRARQAHSELNQIFDVTANGICVVDRNFTILHMNKALREMFDLPWENALGKKCYEILGSALCATPLCPLLRILGGEERMEFEETRQRRDGTNLSLITTVTPYRGAEGELIGIVADFKDITVRKGQEERLAYLAMHDSLTDLPNRILFKDRLNLALAQAQRKRQMLAVLYADLDEFKGINDTLGHDTGDQLLKAVASRLSGLLRKSDTVARMGGDEFLILISELSSAGYAMDIAGKILAALEEPFLIGEETLRIGVSIGVAIYPEDGTDVQTLEKNADTAMYEAKEAGRSTYRRFRK